MSEEHATGIDALWMNGWWAEPESSLLRSVERQSAGASSSIIVRELPEERTPPKPADFLGFAEVGKCPSADTPKIYESLISCRTPRVRLRTPISEMAKYFIASKFDHASRERQIYEAWEKRRAFVADPSSTRKKFVISMPPPNANGPLHLGHALTLSIEDALVRWRRMAGNEVLWLPGTDHASIATESIVIRKLQSQGMADPRSQLKRDGLVREIEKYVEASREQIRAGIRRLGASCDWSRERYTLGPRVNRVVNEIFGRMFHDGLIYRGNRIVHWDVGLQTTLSDDEVRLEERSGALYTIQFGRVQITTQQPEMCLAFTAIAVHPREQKPMWHQVVGEMLDVEWPRGPVARVPVIEDSSVDPSFGTGARGVAPAHDAKDFEVARRHGLPFVSILDENGKMTEDAGPYKGMTRMECRRAFLQDLRDAKLLIAELAHTETVAISERGGAPVEQLLKEQWFIDVNRPVITWKERKLSLRQVMADVESSGSVTFVPEHQRKLYSHWVENLRDWCISRQIWWGHRVPVWYRAKSETYVGARPMAAQGWSQDPDTLDTWFSSALWTWSTLVNDQAANDFDLTLEQILERSPDYQAFHPTTVLETGSDVLFFWVARMILATTYAVGDAPFETVYIHGLIQDKQGRKMSASRPDACIEPEKLITENGTDALRLALLGPNTAGVDTQLTHDKLEGAKRFVSKLWNAARYVAMSASFGAPRPDASHPVNRWMLRALDATSKKTDELLGLYQFGESVKALRDAFWTDFCDFYIEASKAPTFKDLEETRQTLGYALETYLRLLHPFIPFVTEELWANTGHDGFLMLESWPRPFEGSNDGRAAEGVDELLALVTAVRNWRSKHKDSWKTAVVIDVWSAGCGDILKACEAVILQLVRGQRIRFLDSGDGLDLEVQKDLKASVRLVDQE